MVTLNNTFEGVPAATTITGGSGGNTGGISGNFFDSVAVVSGGTLASDSSWSAHGGQSLKVATGSTAGDALANWAASLTSTSIATAYISASILNLRIKSICAVQNIHSLDFNWRRGLFILDRCVR